MQAGPTFNTHPQYYGYYDNPYETEAAYDPGDSAPCLICGEPWAPDTVRTISLMPQQHKGDGPPKSYFFRVHRACHDGLTDAEEIELECRLIDNL